MNLTPNKAEKDEFYNILYKLIPDNNINYQKDNIKTLYHLKYFSYRIMALEEQNYIEIIQILTGIDVSQAIKNKINRYEIDRDIKKTINDMTECEVEARMKQVVKRLQSHYLPKLFMLKKQIVDITKYVSEVYNTNNAYQKIFSCTNKWKKIMMFTK